MNTTHRVLTKKRGDAASVFSVALEHQVTVERGRGSNPLYPTVVSPGETMRQFGVAHEI